jgi:hypothetical protein
LYIRLPKTTIQNSMPKLCAILLCCLFFMAGCKKGSDVSEPALDDQIAKKALSGTYKGYKHFNKSGGDSLAVTIKLEWVGDNKMNLEEIAPFNHIKHIVLNGMEFSYDRGIGEDDCGIITMTGTGNINGTRLYVIETIKCIKGNGPDKFVEYRVTKI